MTVQLTIIGLGQIGASVGLALAGHKEAILRVGHDKEPQIARQAEKMGAVDRVAFNLPASVREAAVVLLALPVDQIKPTLEVIAADLKENAVVMDIAPVKEGVAAWAKELLPEGRHYIGLTPVINPAYLNTHEAGVQAAHADLFQRGMFVIVTSPGTPADVVKLATDFARLLGAEHLFADAVEVDSLMAATHILPQLLGAALLNATTDQPGWREGRKLAGRAYAGVTGPLAEMDTPSALSGAALLTPQNTLRVIDDAIAALQAIRADIQSRDGAALTSRLEHARQSQELWQGQRHAANWAAEAIPPVELPTPGEVFRRFFGFGAKRRKT